jgi:hypothetical protein
LNRHFRLGQREPVIEQDYEPLSRAELTVWDNKHPAPKAGDAEFERRLLKWFADDAQQQLEAAAQSIDESRTVFGGAVEAIVGRTFATAGNVDWQMTEKFDRGSYLEMTGVLQNTTHSEELPVDWLYPKQWNGRVVVWLDSTGKAALFDASGTPQPAVLKLVSAGTTVVGVDLFMQGEFLAGREPVRQQRVVANPREFAGYTFGYNHSLFAQRAHDVLTTVRFLRTAKIADHPAPSSVAVAGFGEAGPIVAAARAVAGESIDAAAIDTGGFRFGKLLDYRHPQFLPGGAKYLDLPGFLVVAAPQRLWLAGEKSTPAVVAHAYTAAGQPDRLTLFNGDASSLETTAATWLLEQK